MLGGHQQQKEPAASLLQHDDDDHHEFIKPDGVFLQSDGVFLCPVSSFRIRLMKRFNGSGPPGSGADPSGGRNWEEIFLMGG